MKICLFDHLNNRLSRSILFILLKLHTGWLDNLTRPSEIHGSRDTTAENALAKLLEYGLNRSVSA
jgi:hypothetical protein